MVKTNFQETFDEYHDLIRKEIARDSDLDSKLSKVEQLVLLMDSFVRDRFSESYRTEVDKINNYLRDGKYVSDGKTVYVSYNQPATKRNRLSLIRSWLSLMLREETRFKLSGNIYRVDFGD